MDKDKGYKVITLTSKLGSLGDMETEWWTKKDWAAYRKRVKQMEKDGTLGQESTVTLMFKEMPSFSDKGNDSFEFKNMGFILPDKYI